MYNLKIGEVRIGNLIRIFNQKLEKIKNFITTRYSGFRPAVPAAWQSR